MKNGKHIERDAVCWYLNDEFHRKDGPAIEYRSGRKDWFFGGLRHRIDGPAIIYSDGTEVWYLDGRKHRENGPAVLLRTGEKTWYVEGRKHREDGPAVQTFINGLSHKEWWINDQELTEDDFNHWLEKKALNEKLQALPPKPKIKKNKI